MLVVEVHDNQESQDSVTYNQYEWRSECFAERMGEIKQIASQYLRADLMQTEKWNANVQVRVGKRVVLFEDLTQQVLQQARTIVVFKEVQSRNLSLLIKKVLTDDSATERAAGHSSHADWFLSPANYQNCIPKLKALGSKGQGGRPLLCVGSQKYHGAAILAAMSCSRVGADYTYLVTHGEKLNVVSQASPDIITSLYNPEQKDDLRKIPFTSILIGSGLDRNEMAQKLFFDAFEAAEVKACPIIVDADGLFFMTSVLKSKPDLFHTKQYKIVLTPNQREFVTLFTKLFNEEPTPYLQAFAQAEQIGRCISLNIEPAVQQVKKLADYLQCCVMVKNIVDICVYKDQIRVTRFYGQPKRCSGQGDVLGGALAALVQWGPRLADQIIFGCEVIKRAASKAFLKKRLGTVAQDIVQEIPDVVYELVPENLQTFDILWD